MCEGRLDGTNIGTKKAVLKFFIFYFQCIKKLLWRTDRDSNPGDGLPSTHFPGVRLRPLGHLSTLEEGLQLLRHKTQGLSSL